MATYKEIVEWVEKNRGLRIHHGCWIAHCKAIATNQPQPYLNRNGTPRIVPCPEGEAREAIFAAFSALGIPNGRASGNGVRV